MVSIEQRIRGARGGALSREKTRADQMARNSYRMAFIEGRTGLAQLRIDEERFTPNGLLLVESLDEFVLLLQKLGSSEEVVDEYCARQICYEEVAASFDLITRPGVRFWSDVKPPRDYQVVIEVDVPRGVREEVARQGLRAVDEKFKELTGKAKEAPIKKPK